MGNMHVYRKTNEIYHKFIKKTDLEISYRTRNTIENILRTQVTRQDIYKTVV
jgi:hypothetical protein